MSYQMAKTDRTGLGLVPVMLCVTGLFALCFQGCERVQPAPEPPRESPASYMNDAAFRTNLVERREAREELGRIHAKLARQMKAMVDAKFRELKIDNPTEGDVARVKAELEKDPEWNSLYARCKDAAEAITDNRRGALRAVRERIAPRRPAKGSTPGEISE